MTPFDVGGNPEHSIGVQHNLRTNAQLGATKAYAAIILFMLLPNWAFGQIENPPDMCRQDGAVQLSAAQTKASLRHATPIKSPLLWSSMRITDAVLVFKVRSDQDGNIACIRAISGHPIILAGAIESLKSWKFRPNKVDGQRRPIYGTIVLGVSCCKHGIESKVLSEAPQEAP